MKAGWRLQLCQADIEDIIAEVLQKEAETTLAANIALGREQESEVAREQVVATAQSSATAVATTAAPPMTNLQKIMLIQQVLDQEVRPVLIGRMAAMCSSTM